MTRHAKNAIAGVGAVLMMLSLPASSGAQSAQLSPGGRTYEVYLIDSSSTPRKDCLAFGTDGSLESAQLGSGGWFSLRLGASSMWWAETSQGESNAQMFGFSVFAGAAFLSGFGQQADSSTGDESQFGIWGFANPACVPD